MEKTVHRGNVVVDRSPLAATWDESAKPTQGPATRMEEAAKPGRGAGGVA